MVANPLTARKRIRDYAAERQRRNARARELGFTSLDTLAKARRRGAFPTAKAIRTNPAEAQRAQQIAVQRTTGARDLAQLAAWDKKSAAWSRSHSRQPGSKFDRSWSAKRRAEFYHAFVEGWSLPQDERDYTDMNTYVRAYPDGFEGAD